MTYHYYIITAIIIIIILSVISHMAENLVSVVSAAWAGLTAIFLFLSGFSFKDTDDPQDISGKGGDHLLFHSTTSTSSWTFRHLFATLHVRWLSHIFNRTACIYQTATRWDLQPYRITIWLIDDVTLSFCLRDDLILAFLLQQFETGNRWIRTRINYHPCITSEPTNQVCKSPWYPFLSL